MSAPHEPTREFHPATPEQLAIWLDLQFGANAASYNVGGCHWVDGEIDVDCLQAALQHVVDRHDALRLGISRLARRTAAGVACDTPGRAAARGTAAPPPTRRPPRMRGCRRAWKRVSTRRADRCSRFALLQVAPARLAVVGVFHHLIADGWSAAILTQDVAAVYTALHRCGRCHRSIGRLPRAPA
jgi:hypothetical protein